MAATVACAHAPKHPRPPTPMTGYDPPCNKRASLIPTTNKPSSARGEIFGDDAVAIARVERLVHHAELICAGGLGVASNAHLSIASSGGDQVSWEGPLRWRIS
jgi:hypothetical protein